MTAMSQDGNTIMREYQNAMNAAENEYRASLDAARRLRDNKINTAKKTMQTKLKKLQETKAVVVKETTRDTRWPTNRSIPEQNWNANWNRTGVVNGPAPVRLFGH